jgi:uroporphyrinogen-III synthase
MGSRPLVVLTRDERPEAPLSAWLGARGLDVFALPTISIEPPSDWRPLDEALAGLAGYDWLAFTSAHAVHALCRRPAWGEAWGGKPRPRLAVVGAATAAALADHGLKADLPPGAGGGRALATAILAEGGGRILWPRSDLARPEFREVLAAGGAVVQDPVAYRTTSAVPARVGEFARLLGAGRVAAVCFLSPSSAESLALALGRSDLALLRGTTQVASIGPTTTTTLKSLGAPPDLEAAAPSAQSLAEALVLHLSVGKELPRELP